MNNDYISVSDLNKYIKTIFDENLFLGHVCLKGEISNLKYHTRGHLYFSLKDETSKINAVMFNYSSRLTFNPKDGDSVLVKGKISVYEASGSYQIYVEEMNEDGVGDLYKLYEDLKNKLYKEGLFDESHKKRIPKIPKRVGIITASTGAAVKDIISTINRRFPLVETILFPSLVQGDTAKDDIVKQIKNAEKYNIDVLIVGRGGGSIEDLWAFNEEIVARAIYESDIPIVSAVGHEIDFTIADFVADLRAPTPTGAAELVVPDKNEILRYLGDVNNRLSQSLYKIVDTYKEKLERFNNNHILNNPLNLYAPQEQKLDSLVDKLNYSIQRIYDKNKHNYENIILKLDLLNPKKLLDKGYSISYINGKMIDKNSKIRVDDEIKTILSNKEIISKVKEINNEK